MCKISPKRLLRRAGYTIIRKTGKPVREWPSGGIAPVAGDLEMFWKHAVLAVTVVAGVLAGSQGHAQPSDDADLDLALRLAVLLQSARSVIGTEQARINDPAIGDKGLSGKAVLDRATETYLAKIGTPPLTDQTDPREAKLVSAMMDSITEVMDANAGSINREGVAFKGFVPAVFGRLVTESFGGKVGDLAQIKVTAPVNLVRNRKSRPDEWETQVITENLLSPDWQTGAVYSGLADVTGRQAFRVMVPEYYGEGCLACHGSPAGEVDVTGYPKEGGALGDLGGVISIMLFR
jgi:hypothetical protein